MGSKRERLYEKRLFQEVMRVLKGLHYLSQLAITSIVTLESPLTSQLAFYLKKMGVVEPDRVSETPSSP